MIQENYKVRFELKPGKWIFVPTDEGATAGRDIADEVLRRWQPPQYYYHFGKRGGHLGALRAHSISKYRASLDLKNFFTSVSRNKVSRALKSIGFNQGEAFEMAKQSCVSFQGRRFLPFGFTQSMVLATLSVDQSRLGKALRHLRSNGAFVSMFVDDLLISADDQEALVEIFEMLEVEIAAAGFDLSMEKCIRPTSNIEVFNCKVGEGTISISDSRMNAFQEQLKYANGAARESILRYVSVVNREQARLLE